MAVSHGRNAAFSTGSHPQKPPQPSTWYDHHAPSTIPTVRKPQANSVQRRVSDQPALADPPGDERGDREGERDGEADETQVEQRRVERHQRVVLEQGVRSRPSAGIAPATVGTGSAGPDHQREEEGRDHELTSVAHPTSGSAARRRDRQPWRRCSPPGRAPTAGSTRPAPPTSR